MRYVAGVLALSSVWALAACSKGKSEEKWKPQIVDLKPGEPTRGEPIRIKTFDGPSNYNHLDPEALRTIARFNETRELPVSFYPLDGGGGGGQFFQGVYVMVPSGANTTADKLTAQKDATETALVYRFGPSGTAFTKPIMVEVAGRHPFIIENLDGGVLASESGPNPDGGSYRIWLDHF